MKQLDKKSIALVDKLIATLKIKSNHKLYSQDAFCEINSCNTEGCLAGWLDFMVNPKAYRKDEEFIAKAMAKAGVESSASLSYSEEQPAIDNIVTRARKILKYTDGTLADTSNLFDVGEDWDFLSDEYIEAKDEDKSAQAALAIKRLEIFKILGR